MRRQREERDGNEGAARERAKCASMRQALAVFLAAAAFVLAVGGATRAGTLPDITGTWYFAGDHTKRCRIEQSGTSVTLTNESGQTGRGTFVNSTTLSTTWNGVFITGNISSDLQTIRWSNGTYWTRASGGTLPAATATPNPYRLIRLTSPTLENAPQGKIALLGGWAAVKRNGQGAVICVSFKNEASATATRVVFRFSILGRSGASLGELELDRRGEFSPGTDINGWSSLSDWQGGLGHHGYNDNCKVLNSGVASQPLLSAHSVTYAVTRVDYADGTSWTPPPTP
jgi:hypothetical protein